MSVRTFLTDLYFKTSVGRALLDPLLDLRNFAIPLEKRLNSRYLRLLGQPLNLKNPQALNEKIQWLKLNDRSDLHVICSDKLKVRGYVSRKIGEEYLIPLFLETTNAYDLNQNQITESQFIVKTNHDSGGIHIVKNIENLDWSALQKKFSNLQSSDYGKTKGEWHYRKIDPKIIVEKLLLDEHGEIPSDYKIHVMNSKVKFIQVDLDRATEHKRNIYDTEWKLMPCEWRYKNGREIKKPSMLKEMMQLAEKLAEDFIYVRVDFYNIGKEIYFGELTFHPESGFGKFIPETCDTALGKLLKLPIESADSSI